MQSIALLCLNANLCHEDGADNDTYVKKCWITSVNAMPIWNTKEQGQNCNVTLRRHCLYDIFSHFPGCQRITLLNPIMTSPALYKMYDLRFCILFHIFISLSWDFFHVLDLTRLIQLHKPDLTWYRSSQHDYHSIPDVFIDLMHFLPLLSFYSRYVHWIGAFSLVVIILFQMYSLDGSFYSRLKRGVLVFYHTGICVPGIVT